MLITLLFNKIVNIKKISKNNHFIFVVTIKPPSKNPT